MSDAEKHFGVEAKNLKTKMSGVIPVTPTDCISRTKEPLRSFCFPSGNPDYCQIKVLSGNISEGHSENQILYLTVLPS